MSEFGTVRIVSTTSSATPMQGCFSVDFGASPTEWRAHALRGEEWATKSGIFGSRLEVGALLRIIADLADRIETLEKGNA